MLLWKIFAGIAIVAGAVLLAVLVTSLVCFLKVFYSPRRRQSEEIAIPKGEIYEPYREAITEWIREARTAKKTLHEIRSFDGLTLRGRYYEYRKGAPIEILFHGYRGSAERDMSGGIFRCFALGHSVLVVDQRASGSSDGSVITFGIRESRDCLSWLEYVLQKIDPAATILLGGVSMGASTVMLAAGHPLPANVAGILADCGYSSARDIICKVIREMHLPDRLLYPMVRLGARLYGGFDPEEETPREALRRATVPVLFIHGDADAFVPFSMSEENLAACASRAELLTVPGAGHGLCYLSDPVLYLAALRRFFPALQASDALDGDA